MGKENQFVDSNSDRYSPLVSSVAAKIGQLIRGKRLQPGKGLPSERQLSDELTVSRTVVRAALRQLAEQGLIEAKPNCRPVVRAVLPAVSVRRHVGIWLWPNSSDYAAASILKGIQSSELGHDVRLIVGHAPNGDWETISDSEARFLESLVEDPEEAGAILWYLGDGRNLSSLMSLYQARIPVVFLDRLPPKGIDGDFVGTNNESAAMHGVQRLISLGHRKIGMITNVDSASSVRQRESGYLKALQGAEIKPNSNWIQKESYEESGGIPDAVDALLAGPDRPTAIFCINDHIALEVCDALIQRKIAVPDDISVLGFDGMLRWLPGGGSLTTLCQDFERMGKLAAELVLERMADGAPAAYRHLLLDAPLVDNGSIASPKPVSPIVEHSRE